MHRFPRIGAAVAGLAFAAALALATAAFSATPAPFLSTVPSISTVGSTVPANGDVNPYGLSVIPRSAGALKAGDYLISNFNAKSNNQGTGTTLVQLSPSGRLSVFAAINAHSLPGSCPGGVGLTTALAILPDNYVVVGSLPTGNGMSATAQYGCLIVVSDTGKAVATISGSQIQGPWDLASTSQGSTTTLFVSNALNGGAKAGLKTVNNSTVLRIRLNTSGTGAPKVINQQLVATAIPWRDDKNALVIGPTGVALAPNGTLYVNDTLDNRIAAIPNAMTRTTAATDAGSTVSKGGALKGPLGLAIAPNGDVLAANANDGNMVEVSPAGKQVAVKTADTKTGAGSLFGLLVAPGGRGIYYVDDGDNTLKHLH